MDNMNVILEKIRREYQLKTISEHKYKCPKCKDSGFLCRTNEEGYTYTARCECYAIRQAREVMKRSGISAEFHEKTFDNFNTKGNVQLSNAKSKAMQYVQDFKETEHDRYNSIMFCGQVGSGKTHLGMAICNELLTAGIAVVYMAYRNALTKLKQNVIDEQGYNRELKWYTLARVLYIDDLLKGKLTDADINIIYEIINYRYMNNLPVIISTEKESAALLDFDEAIGSRLFEMCKGNIVQLQGKELNYRLYS